MATILKDIPDLKKYVSVNNSLDWTTITPYVIQGDRKFLVPAIGQALYDVYAAEPQGEIPKKVFALLAEASANLAMFLYIPLGNVQVNDHGIFTESTEFVKPAEWWQIRDLRRTFLDNGFSALDEALKIMEANEGQFQQWKDSDSYTVFIELFVKRTDTFDRWFKIGNSRRTFLALRPYMLEAQHQYFVGRLGEETMARINFTAKPLSSLSTELAQGIPFKVLGLMQASQVNYTIAKAIECGMFDITPTGIYQKMDDFPGQKVKLLDDIQLNRLLQARITAGEEFFKKAIALIEANPNEFPEYSPSETAKFVQPANTKSTVSF